jgi:hypothetical protein
VTFADELDQLEGQLRRLQIEWEKFFGGQERRPPTDLQAKLETAIRRHAGTDIRNLAERFRYQAITSRFTTFNELWTKRLRANEEGRPLGFHGRLAALATPAASVPEPPAAVPSAPQTPRPSPEREHRVADPTRDVASVRALYDTFAASRRGTGEAPVRYETFEKLVAQQAQRLIAEKGARAIDFRVETKDGKVSLKARPVK